MTQQNPYRIFVSHGWQDHEEFDRFFEFLQANPSFYYENSGRPEAEPTTVESHLDLKKAMGLQMAPAEVVIILAAMYDEHQDWLSFEMELAKRMKKPIIAIKGFASDEIPKAIEDMAAEIVKWETGSIIAAIKLHARGEETGRFEMIDFEP